MHKHPWKVAAQRYLDYGVNLENMYRTDLSDDEGHMEWDHGRISGQSDPRGDDDVDILIRENGAVVVNYKD